MNTAVTLGRKIALIVVLLTGIFVSSSLYIVLRDQEYFRISKSYIPWLALAGGLFLTVLLTVYLLNLITSAARIKALIDERTRELKKSIELNESLLKSIPFGIDIVDRDCNILFVNKKLEEAFGKAAIGKKCYELYRDDGKQCEDCPLRSDIRIGETLKSEVDNVFRGRSAQITHTGMTYQGKEAILEIFEDITERKRIEDRLSQLSMAVEQSPSMFIVTDTDGNIEYANPKVSQATGYVLEEIMDKNPRIFKSGYQQDGFYKELWMTISSGREWRGEFRNRKKDGQLYWEFAAISPIKDASGKITHYIKIGEDITRRKRLENELLESRDYLHRIINAVADPIFVKDDKHRCVLANAAFCDFTGHKEAELLGKADCGFFQREQGGLAEKEETEILNTGKESAVEEHFMDRKGVKRVISTRRSVYIDISGNRFIVGVIRDITERKRLERLKDEFVSTVSHELRTPLSITREGISLLLDNIPGPVNDKQSGILAVSLENIDRLSRIINDLLDISKIESGKIEIRPRSIDVVKMVRRVTSTFQPDLNSKGLEVRLDLPQDEVCAMLDEDKVVQVLINIIDNAIKYTAHGHVSVILKNEGDKLLFSIEDTGVGISKENLSKVFEKFQQFTRVPGPGKKGTGLGLSIAKGIVELHNGRMWVESVLDKGTAIKFTLPKNT